MDITNHKLGTVTTVALRGRWDAATSKAVEDHIMQLIDSGDRKLVIDLAHVEYISSVGLRVLILAAKRVKPMQGTVVVCALKPAIKNVFEVAGFTSLFKEYGTRDEAVAGLG